MENVWLDLLNEIFQVCVIPLLGVLTTFLIDFIITRKKEVKNQISNENTAKYLDLLEDTVVACIKATNQTYVQALKDQNAFDAEAQKLALQMTTDAVKSILTEEAKVYLKTIVGDLDVFINKKIEANIQLAKG